MSTVHSSFFPKNISISLSSCMDHKIDQKFESFVSYQLYGSKINESAMCWLNPSPSYTKRCVIATDSSCNILSSTSTMLKAACETNQTAGRNIIICENNKNQWIFDPSIHKEFYNYTMLWFYLSLVILIFICSLLCNIVIVVAFLKSKKLKSSKSIVSTLHMTFIDLLIGIFLLPMYFLLVLTPNLYIYTGIKLIDARRLYNLDKMFNIFHLTFFVASFINIAFISFERCISVAAPYFHLKHASVKKTLTSIPLIWSYAILTIVLYHYRFRQNMFLFISMFLIPIVVMTISYTILIISLLMKKPVGSNSCKDKRSKTSVSSIANSRKMEIKVMMKLLILCIVFMLCWLPYFIMMLSWPDMRFTMNKTKMRFVILLTFLHIIFDAILYAITKPVIQKEIRRLFQRRIRKSSSFKERYKVETRTPRCSIQTMLNN